MRATGRGQAKRLLDPCNQGMPNDLHHCFTQPKPRRLKASTWGSRQPPRLQSAQNQQANAAAEPLSRSAKHNHVVQNHVVHIFKSEKRSSTTVLAGSGAADLWAALTRPLLHRSEHLWATACGRRSLVISTQPPRDRAVCMLIRIVAHSAARTAASAAAGLGARTEAKAAD
jgi:hypothetical protein